MAVFFIVPGIRVRFLFVRRLMNYLKYYFETIRRVRVKCERTRLFFIVFVVTALAGVKNAKLETLIFTEPFLLKVEGTR